MKISKKHICVIHTRFFARAKTLRQYGDWRSLGRARPTTEVGRLLRATVVTVSAHGEDAGEGLAGVGFFCAGDLLGGALGYDAASAFAAFGAEIDDPVGLFYYVEVVLDDEDGVAERNEALEDVEKFADVIEVQPRCGFVEDVEGAAGLALGKFAGQLDALGFASGERGGGLAELDVAEADFYQRGELLLDLRNVFEELQRFRS